MSESSDTPVDLARHLFLSDDSTYGCAESALVALQTAYDLPNAADSSPAMALNGGVAYSGGICGVITGAAMAVGRLAEERIDDHRDAKTTARKIIQAMMADFHTEFGSHNCSSLTGYDISTQEGHDGLIADGAWRTTCGAQLEFSVGRLAALANRDVWDEAVASLETE